MLPTFQWTTFDVNSLLTPGWQEAIAPIALNADFRDFPRTPGLTREAPSVQVIPRGRVHADTVKDSLGWLYGLYRDGFRQLAERVAGEPVVPEGLLAAETESLALSIILGSIFGVDFPDEKLADALHLPVAFDHELLLFFGEIAERHVTADARAGLFPERREPAFAFGARPRLDGAFVQ